MKNARVLMFGQEFPPYISGGLGTVYLSIAQGLAKNGVQILFVTPKAPGDEDSSMAKIINASDVEMLQNTERIEEFWKHINFMEIGSNLVPYLDPETFARERNHYLKEGGNRERISYHNKFQFSDKYGTNLTEEAYRYALVAGTVAKNHDLDVIHAHDWLTYGAGIVAKRISGKPLVVHVRATEYDRGGEFDRSTLVYDIEKRGMKAADRVVTVSNWTRNIVIEKYGIPTKKVITMHNAVDFKINTEDREECGIKDKIVTFLGRITLQKGPKYFVEAAAKVMKRLPNVHFVMAGSGEKMDPLVRRVAQLGLGTRFHFTDFLRGNDVQHMFRYNDVYVMPSASEPFGTSLLEVMRSGVPTIISEQSGVAEVLRHAIKVDYWDINALSDAIYGVLAYPTLSNFMQREGYEEVNQLKWETASLELKKIYESLM